MGSENPIIVSYACIVNVLHFFNFFFTFFGYMHKMRETLRSLSNKKKKLKYVKQKFDIVNYNIRILLLYVKCSHTRINSCCTKFFFDTE